MSTESPVVKVSPLAACLGVVVLVALNTITFLAVGRSSAGVEPYATYVYLGLSVLSLAIILMLGVGIFKQVSEDRRGSRQAADQSLAEAFAELRAICREEDYVLEAPPRENRPNPFADAVDNISS